MESDPAFTQSVRIIMQAAFHLLQRVLDQIDP